jgi:hypothetical protein
MPLPPEPRAGEALSPMAAVASSTLANAARTGDTWIGIVPMAHLLE